MMRIRWRAHSGAWLELSRHDLPGTVRVSSAWAVVTDPSWCAALEEQIVLDDLRAHHIYVEKI